MTAGSQEIGASGSLGIAFEATLGTYTAPTKWIPIRSESLQVVENKIYRENIRANADRTGAVKGYTHIEGDITFEVTADILIYFLYASRVTPSVVTGPPKVYTFVPAHGGIITTDTTLKTARKTLSLTVQRSQLPHGYAGCAVGQMAYSLDNGMLMCTASVQGMTEAAQSVVASSFSGTPPFGPGDNTLKVATISRADADTMSITINDNLTADNRLNGVRTPSRLHWGEREITASMEHDFANSADFDAFTAQTIQAFEFDANHSSTDTIAIVLPQAVTDSYPVNLPSMGDLVRGVASYHGIDSGSGSYTITVATTESPTGLGS